MTEQNPRKVGYSGAYSSPGTPEYCDNGGGGEVPKSWSSERETNPSIRRYVGGAALTPFSGGRVLPSKWDDAERWITSPVSSYGPAAASARIPRRQPKSKSGPLGLVYLSPQNGNFVPHSPLTAGVLLPDGFSVRYEMKTSGGVPALLSRDEKPDGAAKEQAPVSDGVEQRDMATQMIPGGSTCWSSKGRLSFSALPSSAPTSLHQSRAPASKDEVRDVQVDKGITTAVQSKERGERKTKDSSHIQNIPLSWNASEDSRDTSKLQREEAKITAWENLQKAKAEAAVRKLEMKLEKKRSASMDRIMNKLRASEMKAQAMRNSLPEARTSSHGGFAVSKYVKLHLHSNCFLCRRN